MTFSGLWFPMKNLMLKASNLSNSVSNNYFRAKYIDTLIKVLFSFAVCERERGLKSRLFQSFHLDYLQEGGLKSGNFTVVNDQMPSHC